MKLAGWMALELVLAAAALGQPVRISNARLRSEPVAGGLQSTISKLLEHAAEPVWIAWEVPMAGRHHVCCFGSLDDADRSPCAGRCYLETENRNSGFFDSDAGDCVEKDGAGRLLVFLRYEGRQIRRLRTFSQDCAIDAEGRSILWLSGVPPAQSVALLEKLVDDPDLDRKKGKSSGEPVLSAIAMHEDSSADAALERLVAPGRPDAARHQAAFWLGNARGRRGYEVLRRLAQSDPSEAFRRQITFALSQSPEPQAIDTLIGMARTDQSSGVRSQALFWLAQKAGKKASGAIEDAIREDPETEVKKKAVFALSQLPKDEGIPQLIHVARTNHNPAVRKQAVFWLGQSRDPRALAFFEEVLTK